MDSMEIQRLSIQAKSNPEAREKLFQVSKKQIAQLASHTAGRALDWENDDELSISLIAFNEAIDTYDPAKGSSFWGYAGMVIKHRLIDYFRQEYHWQKRLPLTAEGEPVNLEVLAKERELAFQAIRQAEEAEEREEMVKAFEKSLGEFKISLRELVKSSPKHRDTRENLLRVAVTLVKQAELQAQLWRTKQLPIKELMNQTGQSRKVLERGRRYIIALFLILSKPEFRPMREFLKLPVEVKKWLDKDWS